MGKRQLKQPKAKRKHFHFKLRPKRVSEWKLPVNDYGMGEVPIRECLVWDRRDERGR